MNKTIIPLMAPKSKDYIDILNDLFVEKEITKQEYEELKKKYEYNLQNFC